MVFHNFHNSSTKVIGLFLFFSGMNEGSNQAHLYSEYIEENYKANFKTKFFYSNQDKTLNFNVSRESSPFMKISSTSSSPKKMLTKLKKSRIKCFTKGKYR